MKKQIKTVAFDADDTLWVNELYFKEFENNVCHLLDGIIPNDILSKELFATEMKNLQLYGYGAKGMMLSMIETLCRLVLGSKSSTKLTMEIIGLGQELLQKPIELLDGVEEVLAKVGQSYQLVLATKGDLADQERKIKKSGLVDYFTHIEIMSEKKDFDYQKLLNKLNCKSQEFFMVGNSIKSDIIPVLSLGGFAAHIPYHITWEHEKHEGEICHPNFTRLNHISEVLDILL